LTSDDKFDDADHPTAIDDAKKLDVAREKQCEDTLNGFGSASITDAQVDREKEVEEDDNEYYRNQAIAEANDRYTPYMNSRDNNKAAQTVIGVSDALRRHSGHVKVQGMISSLYPPHKMVTATIIGCANCSYSYSIEYEKPELAPKTVSKECPSCKEEHVSISHRYVNAVNVEVQDTESFSEIERLPVILEDMTYSLFVPTTKIEKNQII
jgi:hypothetical protein